MIITITFFIYAFRDRYMPISVNKIRDILLVTFSKKIFLRRTEANNYYSNYSLFYLSLEGFDDERN